MGFKDAQWAYELTLPMMQKVVLAALCHRTDDKTHQTTIGQEALADMTSSSPDSVRRALRDLEKTGVIRRDRRHGRGGYRVSDLITVDRSYQDESLQGTEPSRQSAYQADSRSLTGSQPEPTRQSAGANRSISDQSVINPPTPRGGGLEHKHEPNARRALSTIVGSRSLPFTVEELLEHCYRLGSGDPWAGYLRVSEATAAAVNDARDPRAVILARLGAPRPHRRRGVEARAPSKAAA